MKKLLAMLILLCLLAPLGVLADGGMHKIRYMRYDGTTLVKSETVQHGNYISIRDGAEFDLTGTSEKRAFWYWLADDGRKFDTDDLVMVIEDMTLTPVAHENPVELHIYNNKNDAAHYETKMAVPGGVIQRPVVHGTSADDVVIGWKDRVSGAQVCGTEKYWVVPEEKAGKIMELEPVYALETITLTLKYINGSTPIESQQKWAKGVPQYLYRQGYEPDKIFSHWVTKDGKRVEADKYLTLNEDTELTAVYADLVHLVYMSADGKQIGTVMDMAGSGVGINLDNEVMPDGRVFSHWLTQDGERVDAGDYVVLEKDLTLTPVYEKGHTITWIAGDEESVRGYPDGSVVICPTVPDSSEGRFTGWQIENLGGDLLLDAGTSFVIDGDYTLIAQYSGEKMVKATFYYAHNMPVECWMPAGVPAKIQVCISGVFDHWAWTDESGRAQTSYPGETVTLTQDTVFMPVNDRLAYNGLHMTLNVRAVGASDYAYTMIMSRGFSMSVNSIGRNKYLQKVVLNGKTYWPGDVICFTSDMDGATLTEYWVKPDAKRLGLLIWEYLESLPKTGDASCLMGWIALLGASCAGLRARRKK